VVDPRAVRATYLVSSVSCDLPTEQVTAGNALNKYLRCSYDPKNGEGCALAIRRAVRAEMLSRKVDVAVERADVSFVDAARLGK
jgi:hypothetical protein